MPYLATSSSKDSCPRDNHVRSSIERDAMRFLAVLSYSTSCECRWHDREGMREQTHPCTSAMLRSRLGLIPASTCRSYTMTTPVSWAITAYFQTAPPSSRGWPPTSHVFPVSPSRGIVPRPRQSDVHALQMTQIIRSIHNKWRALWGMNLVTPRFPDLLPRMTTAAPDFPQPARRVSGASLETNLALYRFLCICGVCG